MGLFIPKSIQINQDISLDKDILMFSVMAIFFLLVLFKKILPNIRSNKILLTKQTFSFNREQLPTEKVEQLSIFKNLQSPRLRNNEEIKVVSDDKSILFGNHLQHEELQYLYCILLEKFVEICPPRSR